MYRITSQLCEAFGCSDRHLRSSGLLDKFKAWLKEHPELEISNIPGFGEAVNGEIAEKFRDDYERGGK